MTGPNQSYFHGFISGNVYLLVLSADPTNNWLMSERGAILFNEIIINVPRFCYKFVTPPDDGH